MADLSLLSPDETDETVLTSNKAMLSFRCETNGLVRVSDNHMIIEGDMRSEIHIHRDKNEVHEENVRFQVKDPIGTFTGRNEQLENLHKSIQKCRNQDVKISILSQIVYITGLAGIGKTETVRMYIKTHCKEYDNIVWINAEHPSEAIAQFKFLAEHHLKMCVKEHDDKNLEFPNILAHIYQRLCRKPKRLLIVFDNATALDDNGPLKDGIRQFLPVQTTALEPPIVLVTSRHHNWKGSKEIKLDLWDLEDCIKYICKRLDLEDTPANREEANEIALLFNRVPITIQMAVSEILEQSEQNRSIGKQDHLNQNLTSENSTGMPDLKENEQSDFNEAAIHKLLHASLEQIKRYEQGQLAIQILRFMAYLSPTNIPKLIIQWLFEELDEHVIDRALALLMRYSIIQRFEASFTIKSVFQDVITKNLEKISESVRGSNNIPLFPESTEEITILEELTNTFVFRIDIEDLTEDDHKDIISNIIHTTEYIVQHSMTTHFYSYVETVASFVKLTQYEVAVRYYTALVDCDINIAKLPPQDTFTKLKEIAEIYSSNCKYQNAFDTYKTLLHGGEIINQISFNSNIVISHGQEEEYGALHPTTLETKNELAYCLNDLERLEEAVKIYWEILEATEKLFGPMHPKALDIKSNLAFSLCCEEKPEEALKLYSDVFAARKKLLGESHPDTLTAKSNIASCLSDMGKRDESLKLYYEVLEARESLLGAQHPRTLSTKNFIALGLRAKGKDEAALKLFYDLLEANVSLHGAAHPSTLTTKSDIALCLRELGRTQEAMNQYIEVLEGRVKVLGVHHPQTTTTKYSMAICLSEQGENGEALKLFYDVLNERQKELGDIHPHTLDTKYRIAGCLRDQGEIEKSLKLYYDVLKEQEKLLGANDTKTQRTRKRIALCLYDEGNEEETLNFYQNVPKEKIKTPKPLYASPVLTKNKLLSLRLKNQRQTGSQTKSTRGSSSKHCKNKNTN